MKNYAKRKIKGEIIHTLCREHSRIVEIRLWLFDSLELIKLQQKKKKKRRKKNTELLSSNQKPSKSDNYKVQQMTKKKSKKSRKNYTYKIRIQLSGWFTWTKK